MPQQKMLEQKDRKSLMGQYDLRQLQIDLNKDLLPNILKDRDI